MSLKSDMIPGSYSSAAALGDETALIVEARFVLASIYSARIHPFANISARQFANTLKRLDGCSHE